MSLVLFDAYTCFGPFQLQHGRHPWSFQHLVDELNHCSISAALVSCSAQLYYDAMYENLRLSERLADHDWLHPIWNVYPHYLGSMPKPEELIKQMRGHNVRAVTIHPKTDDWNPLSRTSEPLMRELEGQRVLTILAQSSEISFEGLEAILQKFPQLPILARAVSWGNQGNLIPLLLEYKNLHVAFDTFQINYGPERLHELGCEDQMVFCSNAPRMSAGAHRFYVDYADIPLTAKKKFACDNLRRLLGGVAVPPERINRDEDEIMAEARAGAPLSTLVMDMHAHILDEGLHSASGRGMYKGGPSGTVKLARRMGVDAIGLMSWNGTVGVHAEDGNRCTRAALDAYPDFFWGLGTFDTPHLSAGEMLRQMQVLFEDKRFLGLKPYKQYGIPYDDKRYDVWWQFGNERRLYALLHPVKGYIPDEFESVCPRFPEMTVLAAHVGGSYKYADYAIELAKKYPNFHAEVTLTPVCGGIIDYLVEGCGADRVVYGSDLPMRDPRQQLGWCVFSRIPLAQKKLVLGGNAKRIVDRVRAQQR